MLVRDILKIKDEFSAVECISADYFLKAEDGIKGESVRSIAASLYVAPSSIIRFCNKIGFDGYKSFKDTYLSECKYLSENFKSVDPNFPFKKKDSDLEVASKIANLYTETVKDCLSLLKSNDLKRCTKMIDESDIVYVLSNSTVQGVTDNFKDKLQKIGKQVYVCEFFEDAYYSACYRGKKACFIVISYSGETPFMLRDMNKIASMKWPSIGITSYGKNSLSDMCDVVLCVSTREKLVHKLGDYAIGISVMYILDAIYSCYFALHYDVNYTNRVNNIENYEHYFSKKKLGERRSSNPILDDKK